MARGAGRIWATVAIWALVACGLWAWFDHQLKNGTEISLKTMPVDPRDILRGDYVVLRYQISTLPEEYEPLRLFGSRGNQRARRVFVVLEEAGGEWRIQHVDSEPPEEGLFLRGRLRSGGSREVLYGIESFFVPEGEGKEYEDARNRDRLWAVVSVSPHGMAHLKRLEIRADKALKPS
ncbi:MAG: GDYXXLXY domain-containing protein [Thermoanaerobaculia bacterium]